MCQQLKNELSPCVNDVSHVFWNLISVLHAFVLQGDYRQLVHELDQYQYCELRLVVLDIRNTYVSVCVWGGVVSP